MRRMKMKMKMILKMRRMNSKMATVGNENTLKRPEKKTTPCSTLSLPKKEVRHVDL
jgi:hypothetical protein